METCQKKCKNFDDELLFYCNECKLVVCLYCYGEKYCIDCEMNYEHCSKCDVLEFIYLMDLEFETLNLICQECIIGG